MHRKFPIALSLSLFALAESPQAQSLLTFDRIGDSILEFTPGPPAGCSGDALLSSTPLAPFPCGMIGFGVVAFDSATDRIFYTDGAIIGVYNTVGGYQYSFTRPAAGGNIQGMGFDTQTGLLWCATGPGLFALNVPVSGCGVDTEASFAVAPFVLPGAVSAFDVDWDPRSNSLLIATGGDVYSFLADGSPGPFGDAQGRIAVDTSCFQGGAFSIAIDTTTNLGAGHFFLTDGITVGSYGPDGALVPMGGALYPDACFAIPTGDFNRGLAFRPGGVPFGAGFDPDGLPAPSAESRGSTTAPGTMAHILNNAMPGGTAYLSLSDGLWCPPVNLLGVPIYLDIVNGISWVNTTINVFPTGMAVGTISIPANAPIGAVFYAQWLVFKPGGPSLFQVSNPITFRIAAP